MTYALRATCLGHSEHPRIEQHPSSTKCYRAVRMKRIEGTIVSLKETVKSRLEDKTIPCSMHRYAETWNIISQHANYIRDLYLELDRMDEDKSI